MKTVLYTGWNETYKPLADLTVPLMQRYAKLHEMTFRSWPEPPYPLNIYWTGVWRGLELLDEGFERCIYLDVDQMITNEKFSITEYTNPRYGYGFYAPRDWGTDAVDDQDKSACCLILHKDCKNTLREIIALEPEYRDKPFQEQAPMRDVLKRRCNDQPVAYRIGRKPFNCVPDQVSPGNVPEPWQPGDFAAHLTMLPIAERIALFHKLNK